MIREPATLATDYLLGAICLVFAWRVFLRRGDQHSGRVWAASLAMTGLGAIAGGTYHGFIDMLGYGTAAMLWKATTYLIGIGATALFLAAAHAAFRTQSVRSALAIGGSIQLIVYLMWMSTHDDFRFVVYEYAGLMILILVIAAFRWRQLSPAAPWLVTGILVSFAAAAIQQSGLSLHRHFNHNDLYHVVQITAMYLLYRAGIRLPREVAATPTSSASTSTPRSTPS